MSTYFEKMFKQEIAKNTKLTTSMNQLKQDNRHLRNENNHLKGEVRYLTTLNKKGIEFTPTEPL